MHALPDMRRNLVRFGAIFAAWTAFGLIVAAQSFLLMSARGEARPASSVLLSALSGAWIWAVFTPFVVVFARWCRRELERRGGGWRAWLLFIGAHLTVAAAAVLLDTVIWSAIRPLIDGVVLPWPRVFAGALLIGTAGYVAIVTITEAMDYASRWRDRDRAARELATAATTLRQQLDEARLRALEAQLRPHFLYNTLNVAAELVHADPDAADAMLTDLGMLLRRSYLESPHLVPLGDEIRFVRAYGDILARRYRDRVRVAIDVPGELSAHPVPAFLLQPLVENAFRHGVERREGASLVDLTATKRDGALLLRVSDRDATPLAGVREMAMDEALEHFDGTGLRNTRDRLALLYGGAAGLTLVRTNGAAVASIWLPLDPAAAHDRVAATADGEPHAALREA